MKPPHLFFSFSYCFLLLFCNSQNVQIDSMRNLLKTQQEDTNKVNTLVLISDKTWRDGNYDQAKKDAQEAYSLSEKLNFAKGKADAYNDLGNICTNQGNYPEALKNHFAALKIRDSINDKKGIGTSYNNIGNIYMYQGNLDDALTNQLAGLKIRIEVGNKKMIANSYFNIGNIYWHKKNYPEAMANHIKAMKIRQEIGDQLGVAYSQECIGLVYDDEGKYQDGLDNHSLAFQTERELGDKNGMAISILNMGFSCMRLRKYDDAREYANNGLQRAKEIHLQGSIEEAYELLANLDSVAHDYKSAFADYKLFISYRDSIFNSENTKKTVQAQMQYDFDKKESATKADQEKRDAVSQADAHRKNIVIVFVCCGLLLVAVFSVFLFNRFQVTRKQKGIIEHQKFLVEEKQKEILDSIHYAKRIQQSLMPTEKYIERNLNELKNKSRE